MVDGKVFSKMPPRTSSDYGEIIGLAADKARSPGPRGKSPSDCFLIDDALEKLFAISLSTDARARSSKQISLSIELSVCGARGKRWKHSAAGDGREVKLKRNAFN
jgi:hypothetical protein